jgi:hypothetical protein
VHTLFGSFLHHAPPSLTFPLSPPQFHWAIKITFEMVPKNNFRTLFCSLFCSICHSLFQ